ncbi:MAG: LptF/LptG family permease [Cytophagaceae bacterium]|nr:LptF/LptG family permease [Cytophagaceae bacterium]MDW8455367.1 LptF/LptG family permease [Cytophagaceae bacterium]
MKILDLYILKKFLVAFFFAMMLIVSVVCILDITERLDDFIDTGFGPLKIFTDYYINFIAWLANLLSPIIIFIAAVFVTARMAAHTEIIAILSSGVSFRRLLFPYLLGSSFIGICIFILQAWILPHANKKRVDFENTYLDTKFYFEERNVHMKISPETYVYLEAYNSDLNMAYQFTLETIIDNKLLYKLKTDKITWVDSCKCWYMEHYSEREFKENGTELYRQGFKKYIQIALSPQDFGNTYMLQSTMTLEELDKYIDKLKLKGSENIFPYLIEKYERFTYPFAIVILTMIGVVVSSKKSREGTGFQIAFGFVLAFVYILMAIVSRNFANVGDIPPLLAVWIPNILFSSIGYIMYRYVPK